MTNITILFAKKKHSVYSNYTIMKKILFLLPILAITTLGVAGCKTENKKVQLTYGTLVDQEATEIKYGSLSTKVARKENMIVATYLHVSGPQCGCWTEFKYVLDQYVKEYNTKIYYIDRFQFSEDDDRFGLKIDQSATDPTFALFSNGKKVNEYVYSNDTKPMFNSLSGFRKAVERIADDPQFMYVDEAYLDKALFEDKVDKAVVEYVWETCPDCNDCLPYVLTPYSKNNTLSTKLWIMDLDIVGLLRTDETTKDKTNPNYVAFMDKHHLSVSSDEKFGYNGGYVPTFQVWEKGELKDASVYFNDTIAEQDGKYVLTDSFYSQERITNLHYQASVLKGMEIPAEQVNVVEYQGTTYVSWDSDSARAAHQPMLESFLNTYVK